MSLTEQKRGHYLGTEIDEKWWRRYSKDGLLARGNGEYWIDASALIFRRYITDQPIMINFLDVIGVKVGKWHSGRWVYGVPVVKVVWNKAGTRLSSGFVLSRDASETEALVQQLRSILDQQATNRD
ncbi:hypothetical protein [Thioalkalivibrio sulfidiphilus]|uniref:PH-like domain-containing protein n=1 Tax=Thioalkalivibrio sulfidiphilus TaxID=1033854 RepID=UPI000381338A|nr:hypothetical protein [Thioalkalivibrio sulfidiphilus]